jgi:hypothetical protein
MGGRTIPWGDQDPFADDDDYPVEVTMETTLTQIARQFVRDEFSSVWDVDGGILSEYLADRHTPYAELTADNEDGMEAMLDEFTEEVENVVRAALAKLEI